MTTTYQTTPAESARHLARILTRRGLYKLSANALQILCELRAADDTLTMSRLARQLGISSATITGIADGLEAHGLVARQYGRIDRRMIWLILTDKGRIALSDILNA